MSPQSPQRVHYEFSTNAEDAYFQRDRFNHVHDSLQRTVIFIGSSITTMLFVRFAFALLSANRENSIVSCINSLTAPLVVPFYGVFNFDHASLGTVSFEGYTLIAIFAYSLLTGVVAKLVSITRY